MDLIVQPEDGLAPSIAAVKSAKARIDLVIFRFDVEWLQPPIRASRLRTVNVGLRRAKWHTLDGVDERLKGLCLFEPLRRSTQVRVLRNGESLLTSNGSSTPEIAPGKHVNHGFFAACVRATLNSSLSQSPASC